MNNRHLPVTSRLNKAYTLMELAISMGMLGIVGGVIYTVLNGGMILFSKNVATNFSNLSVRTSSMRLVQDLHESVGRPELVGLDLQPGSTALNGVNYAQGVRFPLLLNPAATRVISDNSGNTNIPTVSSTSSVSLRIPQQTKAPQIGDVVVFPDINDLSGNTLTRKITAVTIGNPTVITMRDLGVNLAISTDTPPDPTLIYIVRLAAYTVVTTATESNGMPAKTEVRFYSDVSNVNSYTVVNNNMTTYLPTLSSGDYVSPYGTGSVAIPVGPFSLNLTSDAVQVQLISINAETGRRSFVGDRMVLSQLIPSRCQILQSTNYN